MSDNRYIKAVAAASAPRSTATLMKTGQTTSYRTGDDGDIEAGRATSFLALDVAPTHNNGAATINTTTNRFTDTLGGQTYTNNIVLDWATWNGATLLGWRRTQNASDITWANAIDACLALNVAGFTPWRLPNREEYQSIWNGESSLGTNYSPLNLTPVTNIWLSNSLIAAPSLAWHASTYGQVVYASKTNSVNYRYIPVRTFSLSTSNVLS